MQRRYNLTHLILANVVVFVLTPLMIAVDAQARIAFMSDRDGHVHPRLGWTTFEIYVMEVDGNNQRRLTNNPNIDTHPSWSSDGKRIVFSSHRDGNREIYVMDNDGENQQKLTNNPHHTNGSPAWFGPAFVVSPAGKKFTTWGWLKQVDR